jgi:iron complex transport system substrate-binding protein
VASGRPNNPAATVRYAKGFTLEYRQGCKVLRVLTSWRDAKTRFTYVLVPRGQKHPEIDAGDILVETPVRRIVATSTTHVVYFAMLGIEDSIVGIVDGKMVNTPSVASRIRDGRIKEVGNGAGMAKSFIMELLLNLQPDLIMMYGTGIPEFDQHAKLQEAGFRVAMNSEYMETTPLGRTEWMKFIAAFFDKDAGAERLFAGIATRYQEQAEKARAAAGRPTVFCGANFRGVWHMPGGNSFVAAFIRDAGGDYLWKDDATSGSMPMNVESVIARAKDADLWLNPIASRSREELAGEDDRYSIFRAFRTGRVYNDNAKMDAGGGNDIWESGIANPDKVLADLISIMHPELLPKHQRIWYWQLPEKADGAK